MKKDASQSETRNRIYLIGLVVLMALAALYFFRGFYTSADDSPNRVWSEEHGHWHDAP